MQRREGETLPPRGHVQDDSRLRLVRLVEQLSRHVSITNMPATRRSRSHSTGGKVVAKKHELRVGDHIITREKILLMHSFYLRKDNRVHYRDYDSAQWVSEPADSFDYERTDPIAVTEKQLKDLKAILPDGTPPTRQSRQRRRTTKTRSRQRPVSIRTKSRARSRRKD